MDFNMHDHYQAHLDEIHIILSAANRQHSGITVKQALQVVFHAGLAWAWLPVEQEADRQPIRVRALHPDARLPEFKTAGAAGADICTVNRADIPPDTAVLVQTGIAVEIPQGYEGQVRSRGGVATRKQLILLNGVGTVDADYRGEILVPLKNIGNKSQAIYPGDRIAQLLIKPVTTWPFEWAEELSETARADGGFGSTGAN